MRSLMNALTCNDLTELLLQIEGERLQWNLRIFIRQNNWLAYAYTQYANGSYMYICSACEELPLLCIHVHHDLVGSAQKSESVHACIYNTRTSHASPSQVEVRAHTVIILRRHLNIRVSEQAAWGPTCGAPITPDLKTHEGNSAEAR